MPLVWSAYGRAHPEAESVLHTLAVHAARRRGLRGHRLILRRSRVAIGVAIWRWAAAMVHACLPKLTAEEEAILSAATRPAKPKGMARCLAS